jgi:hypothetical protein
MEDADSDLSSDNDSKPPAQNSYSKRPARKKPIAMTRKENRDVPQDSNAAGVEKPQEVDEESSSDDVIDPDYVDENPCIAKEVGDVPQDPNAAGVEKHQEVDEESSSDDADDPDYVDEENQQDTAINPRLPKPNMKYETISIYNFCTNQEAPKRKAYLLFERLFPNSSLNPNPKMGIQPLQITST